MESVGPSTSFSTHTINAMITIHLLEIESGKRSGDSRLFFSVTFSAIPFAPYQLILPLIAWNDRTIPRIAEAVYSDRQLPAGTLDHARLAILADALEEAGCTNADILNHCRQPGEHVRGCWVIDLILGRE